MREVVRSQPVLVTERWELWRPRGPEEVAGLCRLIADEETRRYLGPAQAEPQAQWERLMRNSGAWDMYGYGVFHVRPRGVDDIIASLGIFHSWRGMDPRMDDEPEAGWIVRRDWWGKGVAVEALDAVFPWFDSHHGPRRVVALIERRNVASERVAARYGFAAFAEHVDSDADGTLLDFYERLPAR